MLPHFQQHCINCMKEPTNEYFFTSILNHAIKVQYNLCAARFPPDRGQRANRMEAVLFVTQLEKLHR